MAGMAAVSIGVTPVASMWAAGPDASIDPGVGVVRSAAMRTLQGPGFLAVSGLLAALPALATDVPVGGRSVSIVVRSATRHTFAFRSGSHPAVTAPFPDPTAGAALVVHASNAPGQCHADVALPAAFWSPIGHDGPNRGWRYRDVRGSALGVVKVTIAARRGGGGRISVKAKGSMFPCTVAAPQTLPLTIALRIGGTRYCAAFDAATVATNKARRFRAAGAEAPPACADGDVTLADLNVLHGLFCPAPSAGCRRADRAALLGQFVARGCPDLVTLQEISTVAGNDQLMRTALTNACPSPYTVVFDGVNPFDAEMIFSRHPVLSHETIALLGPLRKLLHARIDHPIGALDIYVTHLASGSDLSTSPCEGTFGPCPPECVAAGAATVRDCQAVQVASNVEATHDVGAPALLAGDFNETPGSFVYTQFASRGWSDTYLAAGNPECNVSTGVGCTSGRADEDLSDLEDPALNQTERIDFIWLIPPAAGSACTATLDDATDADGDGTATRLFADVSNPFAPSCGPLPAAICWSSDHSGVQADVNCN